MKTETATETRPVGRPRKISDSALQRARGLYESGKSPAQIAKQVWCNVSAQTLYYHLRGGSPVGDGQVDMRPRGRKGLSNEQLSRVCDLYRSGMTVGAIREQLAKDEASERKCSVSKVSRFAAKTLSDALKSAGMKVRRGRPCKAEEPAEAAPESADSAE